MLIHSHSKQINNAVKEFAQVSYFKNYFWPMITTSWQCLVIFSYGRKDRYIASNITEVVWKHSFSWQVSPTTNVKNDRKNLEYKVKKIKQTVYYSYPKIRILHNLYYYQSIPSILKPIPYLSMFFWISCFKIRQIFIKFFVVYIRLNKGVVPSSEIHHGYPMRHRINYG